MLKAAMPIKEPRDAKMIGFLPTPSLREELERLAELEDRSLSMLCYILVLKGLDAYQKDQEQSHEVLNDVFHLLCALRAFSARTYPNSPKLTWG